MSGGVFSAGSKPLSQQSGNLPNMREAVVSYFQLLTFVMIKKETVNFQVQETRKAITFLGVVEVQDPRRLLMRPEGERKWEYLNIWTVPDVKLNVDDVFNYNKKSYRILKCHDWFKYGYLEFEAVEDYTK